MRAQLGQTRGTFTPCDHTGGEPLAGDRVRDADAHHVTDERMGREFAFDLGGADVGAAPDDDVLEPSDDMEDAVRVEEAEVTGADPAVGVR